MQRFIQYNNNNRNDTIIVIIIVVIVVASNVQERLKPLGKNGWLNMMIDFRRERVRKNNSVRFFFFRRSVSVSI